MTSRRPEPKATVSPDDLRKRKWMRCHVYMRADTKRELMWLSEAMGVSQAEVVRRAITVMARVMREGTKNGGTMT